MTVSEECMVIRNTTVLTPSQLVDNIEAPENVRVKLNGLRAAPFDIGSLAFSKRRFISKTWMDAADPTPVFPTSIRLERRDMLTCIFDHVSSSKFRNSTRLYKLKIFKKIIDACDMSGCSDFMETPEKCRHAYKSLCNEWRHQMTMGNISSNRASSLQREFKILITLCFNKNVSASILERVNPIKFQRNRTKPPKEQDFKLFIQTAIALARQLKSFVIEEKNFPIKLKMPDYEAFVFQSHSGNVKTPYTSTHKSIYNFDKGRNATFDEWKDTVKHGLRSQYNKAVANFEEVNSNKRHERRIDYATLSMQAYMKIFVLLTGAQPTEVTQLEYSENLKYEKDKFSNDFRAIKFRAKGREISYSLGDNYGYTLFKEYLEIRKWVLNGTECKYLFFSLGSKSDQGLRQLGSGRNFYRYYSRIRGTYLPESFNNITSCPSRKYKNLILSQLSVSLETRASVLNHSTKTNESDYTETTPDRQAEEFHAHWNAVKKAREHIDLTGKHNRQIAVGHCTEEGQPESVLDGPSIQPDCKTQYGCLFCTKYSCHADEGDAHKLYSVLYVIDTVREQSTDFKHAEQKFQSLSIRISEILTSVGEKSEEHKAMIERVEKKVMVSGVLTAFWERRLDQYERMGVIIGG